MAGLYLWKCEVLFLWCHADWYTMELRLSIVALLLQAVVRLEQFPLLTSVYMYNVYSGTGLCFVCVCVCVCGACVHTHA